MKRARSFPATATAHNSSIRRQARRPAWEIISFGLCCVATTAADGTPYMYHHGARNCQQHPSGFVSFLNPVIRPPTPTDVSAGALRVGIDPEEARRALVWAYDTTKQRSRRARLSSSLSSFRTSSCHAAAAFQPDVGRLWLPHSGRVQQTTAAAAVSTTKSVAVASGSHSRSRGGNSVRSLLAARDDASLRGGGQGGVARLSAATVATSAGAAPDVNRDEERQARVEVVKPERDDRNYRHLVLPNGLEVMLVSDPQTETAAASMFIRVGHMQDPPELAGMAHFHEHMLFLGTEKYPEEGDFENFLTQHGGSSNAYTGTESTNYYFDVDASHLEGATDRFAQFFQCPLFTASSMEREMQAVDSEHSNNKNQDSWRLYQVLKATANPAHAFSKFGSGNYETLRPRPEEGVDTRASLVEFHEKYYSADAMKLCILGKEDVETLETWVRTAFSDVRNTAPPAIPDYGPAPAFGASELGRKVTVIPLREVRRLALSWPLPPQKKHRRSKPTRYVSHLLGYEGEGGLHALLHARGWVTSLSAGSILSDSDLTLFRLTMTLTEEGEMHQDEIVELCHRFIALLREEPPQKRIQDELAAMGAIRFRFLEKSNPTSVVQSIATTLGEDDVNPAEVLSDAYTIPEWNPDAITDMLERLTPRNCQILMMSKQDEGEADKHAAAGVGGWRKERWYGTPYKVEVLPEDLVRKLETIPSSDGTNAVFHLPGPNEFIPTDFALRADDNTNGDLTPHLPYSTTANKIAAADAFGLPPSIPPTALETVPMEDWSRLVLPSLVSSGVPGTDGGVPGVKVWHKMDRSYRVPRSIVAAKLWTPEPYGSPEAAVHARMFVKLLREDLRTWAYDAGTADLRYSLEMTTHGLQLSVFGFSSKVPLLLSKILGHIGELLAEYRELGLVLESGPESGAAVSVAGKGADSGEVRLSERQRLLLQRFENQQESFARLYRNVDKEQPHETASYYIRQVMEAEVWHIKEYQRVLEDASLCTPAAMTRHFDKLLTRMHIDVLAHGNMDREEAAALAPAIADALSNPEPLPERELPTRHAMRLPGRGRDVVVELEAASDEEKNSAVQVYLQVGRGKPDLDLPSALELINVVGYTSAFQQLRTKEQLGYTVYTLLERGPPGKVTPATESNDDDELPHPGGPLAWSVVVQSPDKSPAELEERIESWIGGFRAELAAMTDEAFETTVASMISSVLRRERSMAEEAQILFGALSSRTHDFYRRYRKAEAYRRLTKEKVLEVFDACLAPGAPERRKLSLRVASRRHRKTEEVETGGSGGGRDGGIVSRDDDEGTIVLTSLDDIREYKAGASVYE